MRRQCSRYERLRLKKASDRVLHYLACEADKTGKVVLRSSVMEWAAELGLEAATLYRTLSELERDGVLRRQGRVLELC
jgi:DNA-binding MarR family transcriptional regulator